MSLKREHLAKNDYPGHRRVKKCAKRISNKNLRNRLKRETEKLRKLITGDPLQGK